MHYTLYHTSYLYAVQILLALVQTGGVGHLSMEPSVVVLHGLSTATQTMGGVGIQKHTRMHKLAANSTSLHATQVELYPVPYTLYIPCILYPISYILYTRPYTLFHVPYTLYHIPYTLYHTPYTLYPIPYTLYPIP